MAPPGSQPAYGYGGAPPAGYPPGYQPPYGAPPPPPAARRRSRRIVLVVIVVVLILIVGGFAYFFFTAPSGVSVSSILIWAPDNVCGLNSTPSGYSGFNTSTGSTEALEVQIPNYNTTTCTLVSVSTNSSGFSVSATGLPLTVPVNGSEYLNVSVTVPTSSFSGSINFVYL